MAQSCYLDAIDFPLFFFHLLFRAIESHRILSGFYNAVCCDVQVSSFSKGGKALSSYFSYIIPFAGFEGPKSGQHQNNYKPHQPRPVQYDVVNFDYLDPLDDFEGYRTACGTKGTSISEVENKECSLVCENKEIHDNEDFDESISGRSTSSSEVFEEVTCQPSPEKSVTNVTVDSVLISTDTCDFLQQYLPNIVKGRQWILLYR